MLLQSDGSVMANDEGGSASNGWVKLTPDNTGSYVNATCSYLASMSLERQFFASDVLPSGKVFVAGGEFSGPNSTRNETNTGEIYDPIFDSWSNIANFPESQLGDAPSEVLRDGRVLVGSINTSNTYIYNPTTNAWTSGPSLPNGDKSSEESWVKLPDGSILTYEIGGSKSQTANRFVYGATDAQDQWVSAGNVPVRLDSSGGSTNPPELGPGVLLPNGTVFFIGASGNTALYTPPTPSAPTGTWAAGPQIKDGSGNLIGAFDAPAAVMPNGKVLFSAGPIDGTNYSGPTTIFEYDPNTNAVTQVGSFPAQPFVTRMLVLPSGQVLVNVGYTTLWVYTPDLAPQPQWRPTISHISAAGAAYTLWGTQLNGLSEGAYYGDDAEMASNYPIVQLTDSRGKVSYARTWNWDSTGVAPGNTPESVDFMLPTTDGADIYTVRVIANGIASVPVVAVIGLPTLNDSVIVDSTSGSGPAAVDLTLTLDLGLFSGSTSGQFLASTISGVDVLPGGGTDTVDVRSTLLGTPTWISSAWNGSDSIVFNGGGSGTVQAIAGQVDIENSPFDHTTISVDDSHDTTARNVVLSDIGTYPGDPGGVGSITGLAAPIHYEYFWTSALNLTLGQGSGSTLQVRATGVPTKVVLSTGVIVIVGDQGSTVGIQGSLSLEGLGTPGTASTITVDDSADPNPRTTYLDTFTPAGDSPWGSIVRLAPAEIDYRYADIKSLTVKTGPREGAVYVRATGVPTALIGNGGSFGNDGVGGIGPGATVAIGIGNSGTLGLINDPLTIENPSGSDVITVDDSFDTGHQTAILGSFTPPGDTPWGSITGLDSAEIDYKYADTQSLTVKTDAVGGSAKVQATGVPTTLISGGNGGVPIEYVTVGQGGSLQSIAGPLSLENPTGTDMVTIDGSNDQFSRSVSLDTFTPAGDTTWGSITGLAVAPITYEAADLGSPLFVKGGPGGNTFHINSLPPAPLFIDLQTGAGNDTVDLPSTTTLGSLILDGQGGSNTLVGPNNPTIWTINGANAGTVDGFSFSNFANLIGGPAANTFLFQPGSSLTGTITGGRGTNTLDYFAFGAPVTVNLQTRAATATGGFAQITSLVGSASPSNTLVGPNTTNTWSIASTNTGNVDGFSFTGVDNLTGGTGMDAFVFANDAGVTGQIDGGGGGDWLDYAAYTLNPVTVDLATGTATGVAGGIANFQNVRGGQDSDTLTGNAQGNILIGGAGGPFFKGFPTGRNTINGGSGRNLLIGGKGPDQITAGSAGDILIGGYTDYDSSSIANDLALESILAEWQSSNSYATRISYLKNGGGLNGSNTLVWNVTVHDNNRANTLTGGAGLNWYFAGPLTGISGKKSTEQVN
jgi:hypothetical protein